MGDKTREDLIAELELVESSLARFVTSDSHNRRSAKLNYEGKRRLAIRKHSTGACSCRSAKQCVSVLGRLVPMKARPKYGKRPVKVTVKK